MAAGVIKQVKVDHGFGFIRRPNERDTFFHKSDLVGLEFDEQLRELTVQFDVDDSSVKGPRARNVRPA